MFGLLMQSKERLTKLMAKRCESCPACRFARANPQSLLGRFFQWHGSWCPFWKAWRQHYEPKDRP